jgi:hypothetical protein
VSGVRLITRALDGIPPDSIVVGVIAAAELASVVLVVRMWRGPGGVLGKLVWTALTLVPVLGLVVHLVWRDPPPSDPTDRPPPRDWDVPQ